MTLVPSLRKIQTGRSTVLGMFQQKLSVSQTALKTDGLYNDPSQATGTESVESEIVLFLQPENKKINALHFF